MAASRRRWLLTLLALVAAMAGLVVATAPPGSAATGAWTVAPYTAPDGTFSLGLQDASCVSASWCMAVAGGGFAQWDGTSWTYTPTSTALDSGQDFRSLSCTSATWCVAVGANFTGIGFDLESWNGTTWSPMTAPAPDVRDNYLYSVSCTSATFCVAVGWANGIHFTNIVEMWDGMSWTLATVPVDPTGESALYSVSCTSPAFCMAVGQASFTQARGTAMAYTFDGTAWTELTPPTATSFSAVSCLSPTACEVVGQNSAPMIGESWNGSTWTLKAAATPAGGVAGWTDISCVSATSCYAVGSKGVSTAPTGLIEHYTGTAWTLVTSPATPSLSGISCVSTTVCVATGGELILSNYQPGGAKVPKITAATPSVTMVGGGTVTATAKITGTAGGGTISFGFYSQFGPIAPICTAVPLTKVGGGYQASCTVSDLAAGIGGANQSYEIEAAYTGSGTVLPTESPIESIVVLNPNGGFGESLGSLTAFKFFSKRLETPMRSPHCTVGLGSLPAGLALSPTCGVSGTPTAPGSGTFYVIMTGVNGSPSRPETTIDQVQYTVLPLTVTQPFSPQYSIDQSLRLVLTASSGKAPLTWSVASGTLPPGLTLSSGGIVTGAMTVPGTYTVTFGVHDSAQPTPQTASTTVVFTAYPMTIISNEVPGGSVGRLYPSTQLHVSGGKGGYKWAVVAGTVPPGLRFSSAGTLGGTPTTAGTYSFTVQVSDSSNPANAATTVVTAQIAA